MIHLTRFFVVIILTMLYFLMGSFQSIVAAQDSDPEQDSATSIPHADVIGELLNFSVDSDEECFLPCFGGIRPDETTLSEIQELSSDLFDEDEAILARFDKPFERENGLLVYSLTASSSTVTGYFTVGFLIAPEDEVLRRFEANLSHPDNWLEANNLDMAEILAILGEPDEMYISISASQPSYFDMALSYETLGILIQYTYFFEPEQLTQSDEPIPLCGSWEKTYSVDVLIQAVDEKSYNATLEENLNLGQSERADGIVYRAFWTLARMTNWNIEELTRFLIENPEWCFDALSYEELWESGYSY